MRAGFGATIVTPPLGISLAGYFRERLAEGVMDDLYSRAAVVEDDNTCVALVVSDVISIPDQDMEAVRAQITRRTGIPSRNVLIAATHTHTGPVTVPHYGQELDEDYMRTWARLTAGAVEIAFRNRTEVRAGAGQGSLPGYAFNRRYHMKNGYVHTNPGVKNPQIDRVAGPVDPSVTVLRFDDPDGLPIGVIVNFACHPDTTGGSLISADWPGAAAVKLAQMLQPPTGKPPGVVVVNGPSGDLNHIDVSGSRANHWPPMPQHIGLAVAAEAAKISAGIRTTGGGVVAAGNRTVPLRRVPMPVYVAACQKALDDPAVGNMEKMRARVSLERASEMAMEPEEFTVEVVGLRIGPAVIASAPGEFFCELGMEYKKNVTVPYAMAANLACGYIGYIPTTRAFREGGYEARSTRLEPGGGEAIAAAMAAIANEISR